LAGEQREKPASQQAEKIVELLPKNTEITEFTNNLRLQIEALTLAIHGKFLRDKHRKKMQLKSIVTS